MLASELVPKQMGETLRFVRPSFALAICPAIMTLPLPSKSIAKLVTYI
jgi:hypothetical protein